MGASPLSKGSGAFFQVGEIVRCNDKKSDPNAKFVVIKKLSETIGEIEYKIAPYAASRKDFSDYENLLGLTRQSHEIESLGTFVPQQLTLQPTTANLFAGHKEDLAVKQPKQDWKLELEPTAASYTNSSEILDRSIKEAIAILGRQEDWFANYAGYRSKLKLWEVVVWNEKTGKNIGSLFFERMIEASDFDTVDPNENFEWLGEHEGYWWRPCENLETELYDRDLIRDLERLAGPLLKPQKRSFKSCTLDAIGPEAKALIAAINNLPPLPTKNSDPQEYQAYWDVQDGNFQGLRIEICPPNVLLGHLCPGYGERTVMLDNTPYYLGGEWNQLLADPGRYQDLADLLNRAIAESKVSNENSDPFGKGPSIGFGFSIQTRSENEPELLQAKIDLGLWPHNEAATSTA